MVILLEGSEAVSQSLLPLLIAEVDEDNTSANAEERDSLSLEIHYTSLLVGELVKDTDAEDTKDQ